jgi:hypothetical protein
MKHFVIILIFKTGRVVRNVWAESRGDATRAALDDIDLPPTNFAIICKEAA